MSTSLLVTRMQAAATDAGFECDISAHSVFEASRFVPTADVVLVGPQVRYEIDRLRKENPGKVIEPIDMTAYGMVDGAGVLRQARSLISG